MAKSKRLLSLVIPVFNEQPSLFLLHGQIKDLFIDQLKNWNYEIIFVDDGSCDDSFEVLKQLAKKDSKLHIIKFRRNLGKAAALDAGFSKAIGDYVVTLDADLQDGPENIPVMIRRADEGWDMIVGWKKVRQDPIDKILPSKVFNWIASKLSGLKLHDINCGLKLMTKEVAANLQLYGELHRFIPILAYQMGYRVTEIPVTHHARQFGMSKYGWTRMLKGLLDLITIAYLGTFGHRPLHLFGLLGLTSMGMGILFGLYLTMLRFMGETIGRRPLLFLAVLLILAGLQLLSMGLLAEMLVGQRPHDYRKKMTIYEN